MRSKGRKFLIYIIILLAILSIPAVFVSGLRNFAMATSAPFLKGLVDLKAFF